MKAVIFDFDGTIADSLAALVHMYERVRGGSRVSAEGIEQLRSKSMYQIAREMGLPYWKIVYLALWGRRLFRRHLRSVQVFSGIDTLIRELYDQQIKIFVVSTNRSANVRKYLEINGLLQYFDGVYGGASFISKAPTFRRLLKREGIDSRHVWCVGDEAIDIRSAHAAGLKIVSVSWGYSGKEGLRVHHPNKLVDTVAELRKVIL